ncbi:MAG TPA: pseudouridine-5'-phosphate glycosidase [Candidatus Limnocylindrales bacterium]|nr:pseudouridine-5'-phosphate glycosidase [Candidatus Limnocylindrales bacterium]
MKSSSNDDLFVVEPAVRAALDAGRAVVALESALITHGFPAPTNLEVARAAEEAVRSSGAVPATVAILEGRLTVGVDSGALETLARREDPAKASRRDLAALLGRGRWAGTTVSATVFGAHRAGIAVFATGGIGGVHRGGERSLDVSADLDELARTPLLVVCAGPKAILDLDLTLEALETRGVPVVGYGTDDLPGFLARESGRPVPTRVDTPGEAAELLHRQRALGLDGAVLLCVPPPAETALPRGELDAAIEAALAGAERLGLRGGATTPWLLGRLAELTGGRSVSANAALIERNAAVAGAVAVAFAGLAVA